MEEIVVVGYGTQKRVNLTGAVEQVTSEVFPEKPLPGVYYLFIGEKLPNGADSNTQLGADNHTLVFMKTQKRTWNDKLYFYPIPANDLTKNPNLKQNPGW